MSANPQPMMAALQLKDVRLFLFATAFFTMASRALVVIIGFQIYKLTQSTLALGLLGLIEAIPALSLVLFGGYVADHYNRRRILLITRLASFICAAILACLSLKGAATSLIGLYSIIFLAGIARGFADPANSAFESQVVPKHLTFNASSWIGSAWVACSIIGPAAIGFIYDGFGMVICYAVIATCFALSWLFMLSIGHYEQPMPISKEPMLESIKQGWRFVFNNQPLSAAMALDLFAVFFGGVMALLPAFAQDILHVGAKGLGLLNAAPAFGSLVMMVIATRFPPMNHAGRNLLISVACFGISILVFAFSKNFYLSFAALFFSGIFDGISMVIRRSMVRLLSPDHMRGRVSSVGWIFVCSSNELGAFESGILASFIGIVPCTWVGGILTLVIVGICTVAAPQLRNLRFDNNSLSRR